MRFKDIVIYHGGCPDGSSAALAAYEAKFGVHAEYIGMGYNDSPPDDDHIRGKNVYVLDYSFSREQVEHMSALTNEFVLIDHHKTALDRLEGHPNCILDMEHSGATLSWAYFNDARPEDAPEFYLYIEDRDLWKYDLPNSREISSALNNYNGRHNFLNWIDVADNWDEIKPQLIQEGRTILAYEKEMIKGILSKSEIVTLIPSGRKAMVVNCSTLFSEVGEKLCYKAKEKNIEPIGITYFWNPREEKWIFSIRGRGEVDVSKIAETYGGGGHKSAAGFTCPMPPWTRQNNYGF